jgi:hypothetical protein
MMVIQSKIDTAKTGDDTMPVFGRLKNELLRLAVATKFGDKPANLPDASLKS